MLQPKSVINIQKFCDNMQSHLLNMPLSDFMSYIKNSNHPDSDKFIYDINKILDNLQTHAFTQDTISYDFSQDSK